MKRINIPCVCDYVNFNHIFIHIKFVIFAIISEASISIRNVNVSVMSDLLVSSLSQLL